MELTENQKTTKEILSQVLREAWENETFKNELTLNPKKAIFKLTGKKLELKDGSKMVVVDQSQKHTFYFNIPAKPSFEDIELSNQQLDLAAGGIDWLGVGARVLEGEFSKAVVHAVETWNE